MLRINIYNEHNPKNHIKKIQLKNHIQKIQVKNQIKKKKYDLKNQDNNPKREQDHIR